AQEAQDADIAPAQIELVPFGGELGRGAIGMVIVVQFFTTNNDAPGRNIGAGIGTGIVAITPGMANTVDDTGSPEGNPGHLHGPDSQTQYTEQCQINAQHDQDAQQAVTAVYIALKPVIGSAMTETLERFRVGGFF